MMSQGSGDCPYRRLFSDGLLYTVAEQPTSVLAVRYREFVEHQLSPALHELSDLLQSEGPPTIAVRSILVAWHALIVDACGR